MSVPERNLAVVDAPAQHVQEYVPAVSVTIEQAKANFERLHEVTRELMKKGLDYDQIPGTPKPTLLKPGAEHLLQFFGLGHKVQRVQAIEEWEKGFFYYCYRVTVFKTRPMPDGSVYEQAIAECEGSANSKEKRYRNQDVFTIVNTLQKMAIKRALVGATLQATGTSGMFTQDLEDMTDDGKESRAKQRAAPASPAEEPKTDAKTIQDAVLLYVHCWAEAAKVDPAEAERAAVDFLRSRYKERYDKLTVGDWQAIYKAREKLVEQIAPALIAPDGDGEAQDATEGDAQPQAQPAMM